MAIHESVEASAKWRLFNARGKWDLAAAATGKWITFVYICTRNKRRVFFTVGVCKVIWAWSSNLIFLKTISFILPSHRSGNRYLSDVRGKRKEKAPATIKSFCSTSDLRWSSTSIIYCKPYMQPSKAQKSRHIEHSNPETLMTSTLNRENQYYISYCQNIYIQSVNILEWNVSSDTA